MRALLMAFLVLLALLLVPLGSVVAQDVTEPLVEKAGEKQEQAVSDPTGYAQQQATEEQLADDANWTIAYGCYAGYVVTDEAGLPPPDLEPCADFEEALGIEEEQEDVEEPVAEAEELERAVAAEAEALVADADATAGRILEDPGTAPDEALGFAERVLRVVERLVEAVGDLIGTTVDGLTEGLALLGRGAGLAVAAPVVGAVWLAEGAAAVLAAGAEGVASVAASTVDGLAAVATAVGDAAAATTTGIADAVGAAVDAVREAMRGLLPGDAGTTAPADDVRGDAFDPVDRTTDGLLEKSGRLLGPTDRPVS